MEGVSHSPPLLESPPMGLAPGLAFLILYFWCFKPVLVLRVLILCFFWILFGAWGSLGQRLARWLVGELGTAPLGFPSPVSAPGAEGRQNFLTG